jgi:hypothetical protein
VLRDFTARSAPAINASPWTDKQIRAAMENLASQAGVTASGQKALMADLLVNPHRTIAQRAAALSMPTASVQTAITRTRQAFGVVDSADLRGVLAHRSGITVIAIVSRIGIPADPRLGQRVVDMLPLSHREIIAELLLTAPAGSNTETGSLQFLDAILRSGDPFIGGPNATRFAGDAATSINNGAQFITQIFTQRAGGSNETRLNLLRTLGFKHSDILRMNPVGAALWERIDAAVGSYDAATYERFPQLPRSREEAAARILRANISYRDWIMLGVLADRPWSMPNDLMALYASVSGSGTEVSPQSTFTIFNAAAALLGREIPRGNTPALMDPTYRYQINLTALQMFGLGARQIGPGTLGPIPPTMQVTTWPTPADRSATTDAAINPARTMGDAATWQDLMPLLTSPPSSPATGLSIQR